MNATHSEILQILEVGVRAISGFNSQPWRFKIEHDEVSVFLPRTKNFMLKLHGITPMTLGFFLENLGEGARHFGFDMDLTILDAPLGLDNPYVRVRFLRNAVSVAHDISHVLGRRTNRYAHGQAQISADVWNALESLCQRNTDKDSQAHLIGKGKNVLGGILADLESVRFRNIKLMEEIANYVDVSPGADTAPSQHLSANTLDLTPMQRCWFALQKKHPDLMRALSWVTGLGQWKRMKKFFMDDTNAYLVFTVSNEADSTYVDLGRRIQRSLNELTRLGLDGQASVSGLYLLHLCFENPEIFSSSAKNTLLVCRQDLERMFGLPDRHIAFIVRFGHALRPVPLTPRKPIAALVMAPAQGVVSQR